MNSRHACHLNSDSETFWVGLATDLADAAERAVAHWCVRGAWDGENIPASIDVVVRVSGDPTSQDIVTVRETTALRNVLALARRMRKTDPVNAATLARFCAEAGVVSRVTRGAP